MSQQTHSKNVDMKIPKHGLTIQLMDCILTVYEKYFDGRLPKNNHLQNTTEVMNFEGHEIFDVFVEHRKSLTFLQLSDYDYPTIASDAKDTIQQATTQLYKQEGYINCNIIISGSSSQLCDKFVRDMKGAIKSYTNTLPKMPLNNLNKYSENVVFSKQTITEIPADLKGKYYVKTLKLDENLIVRMPGFVYELHELTSLEANYCGLSEMLSEEIGLLQNLTNLSLVKNNITEVPDSMGHLPNCRSISLAKNKLQDLPNSFINLVSCKINLTDNPLNAEKQDELKLRFPNIEFLFSEVVKPIETIQPKTDIPIKEPSANETPQETRREIPKENEKKKPPISNQTEAKKTSIISKIISFFK